MCAGTRTCRCIRFCKLQVRAYRCTHGRRSTLISPPPSSSLCPFASGGRANQSFSLSRDHEQNIRKSRNRRPEAGDSLLPLLVMMPLRPWCSHPIADEIVRHVPARFERDELSCRCVVSGPLPRYRNVQTRIPRVPRKPGIPRGLRKPTCVSICAYARLRARARCRATEARERKWEDRERERERGSQAVREHRPARHTRAFGSRAGP